MNWRRLWRFASLLNLVVGLPGTVEYALTWLGWIEKTHRWFVDMDYYQQVSPFLFLGGIAAFVSWVAVYKIPEWFPGSKNRFFQLEEPIRGSLEMMFAMNYSISEDPFEPPPAWFEFRARLVSLDQDLAALGVPRPAVPGLADYDLAEYLTWQEYLTHLAPMAKNGRLKAARKIRIEERKDSDDYQSQK